MLFCVCQSLNALDLTLVLLDNIAESSLLGDLSWTVLYVVRVKKRSMPINCDSERSRHFEVVTNDTAII